MYEVSLQVIFKANIVIICFSRSRSDEGKKHLRVQDEISRWIHLKRAFVGKEKKCDIV